MPYFWDELGVYARAALYLNDHGIGLLPSALPPELSRGHPLLFSFIFGLTFQIFGDGVLTGHITALCISLIFLLCIYHISKKYFSSTTAIFTIIFLAVQPVFYAQSVMVLPEILLALFILLSIYYWLEEKYLLFALTATAGILTKETAVIIPLVIGCGNTLHVIFSNRKMTIKPAYFLLLAPWIIFGLFLLIQKQQNGWYLFPLHESSLNFEPQRFIQFLGQYAAFVFIEQGRFIMLLFILLFVVLRLRGKIETKSNAIVYYLIVVIAGGLLFSSVNFYMNRYTLFIITASAILAGQVLSALAHLHQIFKFILPMVIIAPFIFTNNNFDYDISMNYKKYVVVQKEAVEYVVGSLQEGDALFANFPAIYSLRDSRFGYCDTTEIKFEIIRKSDIDSANYFMLADPGAFDHVIPQADKLQEIKIFQNAVARVQILKLDK